MSQENYIWKKVLEVINMHNMEKERSANCQNTPTTLLL